MNTTTPSSFPDADALERLLAERYSCRAFLPRPVPQAIIERILAFAQRTASWCNAQPWQVAITRGAGTERFRQAMFAQAREPAAPDFPWPREYQGAYLQRRRECGYALYESVGVARGDREASERQARENFRFFGAPHLALVTTETLLGTYGAVDCGAYVNNFVLAARSLGVASIAQAAVASRAKFLHRWFDIPDDRQVVCGIAFGYEDPSHPANRFRTTRAAVEQVCRWVD
jgi:nitroreductase